MPRAARPTRQGLDALRRAVASVMLAAEATAAPSMAGGAPTMRHWLLTESSTSDAGSVRGESSGGGAGFSDASLATSSEDSEAERTRLIGLVELARTGDAEAFGLLFDHYHGSVYRFLYYRTRSVQLAEDLSSETFVRALRNMANFRWQGKDFGAWLMTIARNLATDHFKAGRTRLELTTEDMGAHDAPTSGPEAEVLGNLTHEILLRALTELPGEQKDCLVMRFLQSMSIAETAEALGRSEGAVKQLQLRGVRNLAKLVPDDLR